METTDQREPRRCMLVRVVNSTNVCLVMHDTHAVVMAELATPLSPRSRANAQLVNALKPVPASVRLGGYDIRQHRFTGCAIEAQLPEANYSRLAYAARQDNNKKRI